MKGPVSDGPGWITSFEINRENLRNSTKLNILLQRKIHQFLKDDLSHQKQLELILSEDVPVKRINASFAKTWMYGGWRHGLKRIFHYLAQNYKHYDRFPLFYHSCVSGRVIKAFKRTSNQRCQVVAFDVNSESATKKLQKIFSDIVNDLYTMIMTQFSRINSNILIEGNLHVPQKASWNYDKIERTLNLNFLMNHIF